MNRIKKMVRIQTYNKLKNNYKDLKKEYKKIRIQWIQSSNAINTLGFATWHLFRRVLSLQEQLQKMDSCYSQFKEEEFLKYISSFETLENQIQ